MSSQIITLETAAKILERRGLHLTRRGTSWQGRCPLHQDTHPSLRLWCGRDGRPVVSCFPCSFHDSLPAFLCRWDGQEAKRRAYRSALVECGMPTRDNRPLVKGPPPPIYWPNGQPFPDEKAILSALADVGVVDLESLSTSPGYMGEPSSYPANCWIYAPIYLRYHPQPARLTMEQQAALIVRLASLEESPRLHSVLMAHARLFGVWERNAPPFVRLCHRLGHDPEATIIGQPTRTIFHRA